MLSRTVGPVIVAAVFAASVARSDVWLVPTDLPWDKCHPVILVHGGADDVDDPSGKLEGTKQALRVGYELLHSGNASALEIVIEAIKVMEDHPAFDAGRGSTLTLDGHIEMDAAIIDGTDLGSGSVATVTNLRNPIEAARAVMQHSSGGMMVGEEATRWALHRGLERAEEKGWLITEEKFEYWQQWLVDTNRAYFMENREMVGNQQAVKTLGKGTVGAVVLDRNGNVASGTSTGGWTGKLPGRVGDSPGIGHGLFADNDIGGVSCTGLGESFMKVGAARRVSYKMSDADMTPDEAIKDTLDSMTARVGGDGGMIVVDKEGRFGVGWNSNQMGWGYALSGHMFFGVNKKEVFNQRL